MLFRTSFNLSIRTDLIFKEIGVDTLYGIRALRGLAHPVSASLPSFENMRLGIELSLSPEQPHWPHPQYVALGSHSEWLEVIIALGFPSCPSRQEFPLNVAFVNASGDGHGNCVRWNHLALWRLLPSQRVICRHQKFYRMKGKP